MSKKRTFLKILSAAVLALSVIMLALTAFTCILLVQLRRQNLYPFREPVRGGRDDRRPGLSPGEPHRLQQGVDPRKYAGGGRRRRDCRPLG